MTQEKLSKKVLEILRRLRPDLTESELDDAMGEICTNVHIHIVSEFDKIRASLECVFDEYETE